MPKELEKSNRISLNDLAPILLAGEPAENESGEETEPSIDVIITGLKKKAEQNRQGGEIYPYWDPVNQGKGAEVIGVLLDKRIIHKERDMPMFIIDTQTPVRAIGRGESGQRKEYDSYKGPVTIWCGTVLARQFDKAEPNRLTYIKYLGQARGQTGRRYNDFLFTQASKDELLAWTSKTK